MANNVSIRYTGSYQKYGNAQKGWVELLSSGTLTISGAEYCDIYLIGSGSKGGAGGKKTTENDDGTTSTSYHGGSRGAGGKSYMQYAVPLSGKYTVEIGAPSGNPTTLGDYSSANGWNRYTPKKSYLTTTYNDGVQPFSEVEPMNQGFAAKKLGAYGTSGTNSKSENGQSTTRNDYGGGLGGIGTTAGGAALDNSGSGGGGGGNNNQSTGASGGKGGSGIAIVRWGYFGGAGGGDSAQSALIDGASRPVQGMRVLVDGVGYAVQKGRTLIDGVGYDILFGGGEAPVVILLEHESAAGPTGGDSYKPSVSIEGQTYTGKAADLSVPAGTEITCTVVTDNKSTYSIRVNGTVLTADSNNAATVTLAVDGGCVIEMAWRMGSSYLVISGDVRVVTSA